MDSIIAVWRPWIFLFLCALQFLMLVWLLAKRNGKGAIPALLGAVVCAFFSEATDFELFKFSAQNGLEARARAVVTEAHDTTAGLRSVAVAASAAIVGMTSLPDNGGVAETQPARIRDQNKNQLISILQSIGVSESQLKTVELADRESVIQRYDVGIWNRINNEIQKQGTQVDRDSLQIMTTADGFQSPDKIVKFLAALSIRDQFADDLAKDFAYYMANGKQRRPEVWAARDEWSRAGQ
jgi:hypothetical protein